MQTHGPEWKNNKIEIGNVRYAKEDTQRGLSFIASSVGRAKTRMLHFVCIGVTVLWLFTPQESNFNLDKVIKLNMRIRLVTITRIPWEPRNSSFKITFWSEKIVPFSNPCVRYQQHQDLKKRVKSQINVVSVSLIWWRWIVKSSTDLCIIGKFLFNAASYSHISR